MNIQASVGDKCNYLLNEFRWGVALTKNQYGAAPVNANDMPMRLHLSEKEGYIYLALSDTGHVKIGRSKAPIERVRHFSVLMPIDIDIVFWFYADDYKKAERLLHEQYDSARVNGEWFALDRYQVSDFLDILCFVDGEFHLRGYVLADTLVSDVVDAMFKRGAIVWANDLPY